jgi:hypothetical protein
MGGRVADENARVRVRAKWSIFVVFVFLCLDLLVCGLTTNQKRKERDSGSDEKQHRASENNAISHHKVLFLRREATAKKEEEEHHETKQEYEEGTKRTFASARRARKSTDRTTTQTAGAPRSLRISAPRARARDASAYFTDRRTKTMKCAVSGCGCSEGPETRPLLWLRRFVLGGVHVHVRVPMMLISPSRHKLTNKHAHSLIIRTPIRVLFLALSNTLLCPRCRQRDRAKRGTRRRGKKDTHKHTNKQRNQEKTKKKSFTRSRTRTHTHKSRTNYDDAARLAGVATTRQNGRLRSCVRA